MRRILVLGMLLGLLYIVVVASLPAAAQSGNLLQDPGFAGPYVNRGRSTLNTPAAWPLWIQNGPTFQGWENRADLVFAFPHCAAPQVLSGPCSFNINGGFATWPAAIYQQVAVPRRSNVQGSVYAWVQTCNSRDQFGNFPGGPCGSSPASGVFVRVGIDPNGGTDPGSPAIIWGPAIAPHDHWEQATVNATALNDVVTFFIYSAQEWPSDFNNRWYDDASLTIGGPGGSSANAGTGSTGSAATRTPRPTSALPIPQPPQADGSQVHVVQYGDTLSGIAVIYGISLNQLLEANDLTMAQARNVPVGTPLDIPS